MREAVEVISGRACNQSVASSGNERPWSYVATNRFKQKSAESQGWHVYMRQTAGYR